MANMRIQNEATKAKIDLKKSYQQKIQHSHAFQFHSIPFQHEICEAADIDITPMPELRNVTDITDISV